MSTPLRRPPTARPGSVAPADDLPVAALGAGEPPLPVGVFPVGHPRAAALDGGVDVGEEFRCLPARVLYRSTETWTQHIWIHRGSDDGVREGQGVICTEGIVGRIANVTAKTACVELVTSAHFRLLVKLEGEAEPCLLQSKIPKKGKPSSGKAVLSLAPDITSDSCPRMVETIAVGHQFPNHLYVGQCVKIKSKNNRTIGVVRFGRYLECLEEVGVLIPSLNL